MTTSIRNPRPESKPESRVRKGATEFEASWRDPERTLVDYLAAVWSRKIWVGLSTAGAMAVAVVFGLTQPNVYVSQASLLVIGSRSGANAAEVASNMLRMGNIGPSQVLSALEVVNSSVVAQRVVERVTPAEITKPYQPERAADEERQKMGLVDKVTDWMHRIQSSWFQDAQTAASLKPEVAAEVFRASFTAWADERASLIKLAYRAGSRAQAQRILAEAVQAVVERYREVCAPPESREWVQQRVEAADKDYTEAKREHDEFIAKHGRVRFTEDIVTRERARATAMSTLMERRLARDTTRQNLEKYTQRLQQLDPQRRRERDVTQETAAARADLLANYVVVENLKIDRQMRDPKGYEDDVMYRIYRSQLENIDRRLKELDAPRRMTVVDDNPEYIYVDTRIRELSFRQTELDNEIPQFEQELEAQDKDLKELYALQAEADRVVERFTRAKTKIESMGQVKDQYEFDAQLSTLGLTSLQRVDEPTLPLVKEGPRRTRIILAGAAGGLLASLTLIMLLVRMSKTFLRTSEVAVCLGRGDVVGMPWLERGNVRRFRLARKKGWD